MFRLSGPFIYNRLDASGSAILYGNIAGTGTRCLLIIAWFSFKQNSSLVIQFPLRLPLLIPDLATTRPSFTPAGWLVAYSHLTFSFDRAMLHLVVITASPTSTFPIPPCRTYSGFVLPAESGCIYAQLLTAWRPKGGFSITSNEPVLTRRPLPTRTSGTRQQCAVTDSPPSNNYNRSRTCRRDLSVINHCSL